MEKIFFKVKLWKKFFFLVNTHTFTEWERFIYHKSCFVYGIWMQLVMAGEIHHCQASIAWKKYLLNKFLQCSMNHWTGPLTVFIALGSTAFVGLLHYSYRRESFASHPNQKQQKIRLGLQTFFILILSIQISKLIYQHQNKNHKIEQRQRHIKPVLSYSNMVLIRLIR